MRPLLVVALLACAPKPRAGQPIPKPPMTAAQWSEAWDLVTEFGEAKAEVTPWRVENAGAIIVSRVGPRPVEVADGDLQGRIKSSIGDHVTVTVRAGVAHLHGGYPSREEAGRAIFGLLGLPGLDQVVSHLTWPGSEQKLPRPRLQID